ncbi:hypothetical protein [Dolichospermum phage Dfl-JY45]
MRRQLDDSLLEHLFAARGVDAAGLFSQTLQEAFSAAVADARSLETSTATPDDRLPPTTFRLRPKTGVFFRSLGARLGISTQAAIALTLDGFVDQAVRAKHPDPSLP